MTLESKVGVLVICILAVCLTILYTVLFLSLWAYKELVGASLLIGVLLVVGLWRVIDARGKVIEQDLRQMRYHYRDELPLDSRGEPVYWPAEVQMNPHRRMYASISQLRDEEPGRDDDE